MDYECLLSSCGLKEQEAVLLNTQDSTAMVCIEDFCHIGRICTYLELLFLFISSLDWNINLF